jgi:hypothetical protein
MVIDQTTDAKNGFVRWMDVMEITKHQAATLLGKSIRTVEMYEAGTLTPPHDLRLLMDALAEGYHPRLWPLK